MAIIYYGYDDLYKPTYVAISNSSLAGKYPVSSSYDTDVYSPSSSYNGPFYQFRNSLTKIIILDQLDVVYANKLFYGLSNVTHIDNMEFLGGGWRSCDYMFAGCSSLDNDIIFYNVKTINCTDMTSMFEGCTSIGKIDLTTIATDNVTNAAKMFKNCGTTNIDMTGCNLTSVTTCYEMFAGCGLLTNISGTSGLFNFIVAANDTNMFLGSSSLPNYNASKVNSKMAISKDSGGYITMAPEAKVMVNTRIQLKYDTALRWKTFNPTPLAGEMCIESDTLRIKVGDGSNAYNDLDYVNDCNVDAITIVKDAAGQISVPIDNDTIAVNSEGKVAVTMSEVTDIKNFWRSLF